MYLHTKECSNAQTTDTMGQNAICQGFLEDRHSKQGSTAGIIWPPITTEFLPSYSSVPSNRFSIFFDSALKSTPRCHKTHLLEVPR